MRRNKLALPDVPARFRVAVVTSARATWKENHPKPTERVLRTIRFVWMRHPFSWGDRHKLNGATLGAAMRLGLMEREKDTLVVTRRGGDLLNYGG